MTPPHAPAGFGLALRHSSARWVFWVCAAAFALALTWAGPLRQQDSRLHDAVLRTLPAAAPTPGITLIDIDEASLAALGPWPWPRPLLARIMQTLREQGATLQVWDLTLTDPAAEDQALQAQLAHGDIVLGQVPVLDANVQSPPRDGVLHPTPAVTAPPLCSDHATVRGWLGVSPSLQPGAVGHLAATPNPDGLLRRLPAVICQDQLHYPQLALAAAQAAQPGAAWVLQRNWQPWASAHTLTLGNWAFSLDGQGWLPLPHARAHGTWPAISVQALFNPAAQAPKLQGHTVLIGATALGMGDIVSTPYHPNAPGVSIHADLLSAATSSQPWPAVPWAAPWWAALLALVSGASLLRLQAHTSPRTVASVTVATALLPMLLMLVAWPTGMRLPVWPVVLAVLGQGVATLIWQVLALRRESVRLAQHLQGFMSPELARRIVQHSPSSESLGQTCTGLVLALRIDGLDRWVASVGALQALGLTHAIHAAAQMVAAQYGGRVEHVMGHTLLLAWPSGCHTATQQVIASVDGMGEALGPVLSRNETITHPLSLQMSVDNGIYLLGVVGSAASRRSVLLGPAPTRTLAMLDLCAELASPVVFSHAAVLPLHAHPRFHTLGYFLLPEQAHPTHLYRLGAQGAPA